MTSVRKTDASTAQRRARSIALELVRAEDGGDPHAFRQGLQEYHLRWPGGEYDVVQIRWDDALMTTLAALRGASPEAVQQIGGWLRSVLAHSRWSHHEQALLAEDHGDATIDITLTSAAAELYALPWELLTLGPAGTHLGELPAVQIRYRWPGTSGVKADASTRREGGRLLFGWSQAFGALGQQHFLAAIQAAAARGGVDFDVHRDVVEDMSFERLFDALGRRCQAAVAGDPPPVILHLLCHGVAADGGYGLGLDGPGGQRTIIDAGRLRTLGPFARFVRLVVLTVCDGGNAGAPGSQLGSAAQALHRAGFESVIASRTPLTGGGALAFCEVFYGELFAAPASVEAAFAAARLRLRVRGGGLDWASFHLFSGLDAGDTARPLAVRPYRGLLAFEALHARFFFGREDERDEALRDLDALVTAGKPRLLIVSGASGTGKSSVVLAGVVPALVARGWQAEVLRPGRDPLAALDGALARRGPARLLLVVDQFEEVFTHRVARDDGSRLTRRLWRLAADRDVVTAVILTLRVDYLGHCGELTLDDAGARLDRVAYDESHRVFVPQIARERLHLTIDAPAEKVGLTLEQGLCERIVEQVGDETGALPLLQYALDELWSLREADTLTHAALDRLGGVVGAISRRADAVWEALGEPERAAARRLLVRMVAYGDSQESGTRRQVMEAELRPHDPQRAAAFDGALRALVDARLVLRSQREGAGATLDIAHEALIRRYARLWGWYQEDRASLAEMAQLREWVAEWRKFPDNLLTGNKLGFASRLRDMVGQELGEAALELIARSSSAVQAQRRRRLALTTLVGSVLLVAAIVASVFAWEWRAAEAVTAAQRDDKDRLMRELQWNQRKSEIRRLAAVAELEIRREQLTLGLLIAAEAARQEAELTGELMLGPVSEALRNALAEIPDHRVLHIEREVTAMAFHPDGTRIATADDEGDLRLWPTRGNDPPIVLLDDGPRASALEFSRDGDVLLSTHSDGVARLWHPLAAGARPREFRGVDPGAVFARTDPAGQLVAMNSSRRGPVLLFRSQEPDSPTELPLPAGMGPPLRDLLAFSRAGDRLLVLTPQAALVWRVSPLDLAPPTGPTIFTRRDETFQFAALDADGARLMTTSVTKDGRQLLRLWDMATPAQPLAEREEFVPFASLGRIAWPIVPDRSRVKIWDSELKDPDVYEGPRGLVEAVAKREAGRAVSMEMLGPPVLWGLFEDAPITLRGHSGPVTSAVFAPSGELVATAGRDLTVRIWPVTSNLEPLAFPRVSDGWWLEGGAHVLVRGFDNLQRCDLAAACEPMGAPDIPRDGLLALSPDERSLFIHSPDTGRDTVLSLGDRSVTRLPDPPAAATLQRVLWTPDGRALVRDHGESGLDLVRPGSDERRVLVHGDASIRSFAVSPDSAHIATGDADGAVLVRPTGEGRPRELHRFEGPARHVRFGVHGELVAVPEQGRAVLLQPAPTDAPPQTFGEATSRFTWALPGPRGLLATGAESGLVELWTIDGGAAPLTFTGHRNEVQDGTFSADGSRLATTALDGTARIWRTDRAGEGTVLRTGPVRRLVFSPDGRHLLTSSDKVQLWTVHTADLVARACRYVSRDVSRDEWREYFTSSYHENCAGPAPPASAP